MAEDFLELAQAMASCRQVWPVASFRLGGLAGQERAAGEGASRNEVAYTRARQSLLIGEGMDEIGYATLMAG